MSWDGNLKKRKKDIGMVSLVMKGEASNPAFTCSALL
jgi:hypothetical protein